MCAPAALAKMYAASDTQPIFGVPAKPAALRGKEEQGSGRMAYFEAAGIKISRSKADFAPTWYEWRYRTCGIPQKPNRSPATAGPVWKGGAAT